MRRAKLEAILKEHAEKVAADVKHDVELGVHALPGIVNDLTRLLPVLVELSGLGGPLPELVAIATRVEAAAQVILTALSGEPAAAR